MKRNDMNVSNIPHVITAACILHNVCEVHHEHFNDAWIYKLWTHSMINQKLLQVEIHPLDHRRTSGMH